jgi:hypothetical protein
MAREGEGLAASRASGRLPLDFEENLLEALFSQALLSQALLSQALLSQALSSQALSSQALSSQALRLQPSDDAAGGLIISAGMGNEDAGHALQSRSGRADGLCRFPGANGPSDGIAMMTLDDGGHHRRGNATLASDLRPPPLKFRLTTPP